MPRKKHGNTGPTTCQFCNKKFTANRYYLHHFKYQVNARCKRLLDEGFQYPEPQLPQKRTYDNVDNVELPSSQGNDDFRDGHPLPSSDANTQESSDDDSIFHAYAHDSDDDFFLDDTPEPDSNTQIMNEFKDYTRYAFQNFCELTEDQEAGIELMSLLAEARVPLSLWQDLRVAP